MTGDPTERDWLEGLRPEDQAEASPAGGRLPPVTPPPIVGASMAPGKTPAGGLADELRQHRDPKGWSVGGATRGLLNDTADALDALVAERDAAEQSRERWVAWHSEKCEELSAALAGVSPGTGTEPVAPGKTSGAPDGGAE